MSYNEQKIIDQITVTENGHILFREATRVLKDGQEIAKTYHRNSLFPGQDLTGIPTNVAAIANVVWTQEVIQNYENSINN
jgi:archaellum component FlaF (FlaF/FlaG flagellin family)